MAIEIKQLLIKSSVVDDAYPEANTRAEVSTEAIRYEVLEECRRLIQEMLNDKGQR